jgi:hypothetical protein
MISAGTASTSSPNGILGSLRILGIQNIHSMELFKCTSLRCELRKVACIVRRNRIKMMGHGRIGPEYPDCYSCSQGAQIELEILAKHARELSTTGSNIQVVVKE